jgi:hypothetical protein
MDIPLFSVWCSSKMSFYLAFNHGIVPFIGKLCPSLVQISLKSQRTAVLSVYEHSLLQGEPFFLVYTQHSYSIQ